ncbi:hypothetical protein ACQKKX_04570 [Neorhizobium sp. NPDC001467]|uniref:hypothetical protein n=1 Tax=Neorhizobium sp. NPDC001467 TaxID=3390595 RepID=UPI003CFC4C21
MSSTTTGKVLRDPASGRLELHNAIKESLPDVHRKVLKAVSGCKRIYLVGNGYDFDEFSARLARSLGDVLSGAACLWMKPMPHPFPNGWRSFLVAQEMVEPTAGDETALVLGQSVVADEFELVTAAGRVWEGAAFERVVIAGAMIERKVGKNLAAHFQSHLSVEVQFAPHEVSDEDLSEVRDRVLETLDDRPVKLIPPMLKWMMRREFGPRPGNDSAPQVSAPPRRPGR